jgi:glucose-1-phosphate cytidylyltransferase
LLAADQLLAQRHNGFWAPMDTLKDQQWLESLHENNTAPWQLWDADRALEAERSYASVSG